MNATLLRAVLAAAAEWTGWGSAGTATRSACTIALAMTDAMRGTLIIPPRKGTEK